MRFEDLLYCFIRSWCAHYNAVMEKHLKERASQPDGDPQQYILKGVTSIRRLKCYNVRQRCPRQRAWSGFVCSLQLGSQLWSRTISETHVDRAQHIRVQNAPSHEPKFLWLFNVPVQKCRNKAKEHFQATVAFPSSIFESPSDTRSLLGCWLFSFS